MMDFTQWQADAQNLLQQVVGWLKSPQFYAQVAAIAVIWVAVRLSARNLVTRVWLFNTEPTDGRLVKARKIIYACADLVKPLLLFVGLAIAAQICDQAVGSSWLVRAAQSLAVISLLYAAINRFLKQPLINAAARWVGIPAATLYAFGYMPQVIDWLDHAAFEAGNVRISLLTLIKAALFGGSLFWLGRVSSRAGERVIRQQESLDVQTRELATKGFDLFVACFAGLLLLNLLGIDLSILAVFSGAVGVGLGFGLQQIASNFMSGVIILLERSLKVGDFIELEDGRSGHLLEINMRQSRLGTFDGKDIMVPNDRFITTRVVNWTHADPRQRYEVPFTVTYDTDIHAVPPLIVKALLKLKGVLREPEMPECALKSFGDTAVNFTAKFWVEGIDDGVNSYTSDALFAVWDALKEAGIKMKAPPPQIQYVSAPDPRKAKS
ncbi:MAG: mechanosensitive ion channel [Alphaproteobacteria bacterium]|nr:mechanosensitive ion channel [Alphaproteobacteria bacterium]